MATSEIGIPLMEDGLRHLKTRATANAVDAILTEDWVFGDSYTDITTVKNIAKHDILDATIGQPQGDGVTPAGREITVGAFQFASADNTTTTGTTLHVCLVDSVNSTVLAVNDVSNDQAITAGNPVNVASYKIGISQAPQS